MHVIVPGDIVTFHGEIILARERVIYADIGYLGLIDYSIVVHRFVDDPLIVISIHYSANCLTDVLLLTSTGMIGWFSAYEIENVFWKLSP